MRRTNLLLILTLLLGNYLFPRDGDVPERAIELPLSTWVEGTIGSGGSIWYKFSINTPGQIVAHLVIRENQCTSLYLYDQNGVNSITRSVTCSEGEANKAELRWDLARGSFYLNVEGKAGMSFKLRVVNLQVKWPPDKEPNNDFTEAIKLAPKTWNSGAIGHFCCGHRDSQDWYAIEVPHAGRIIVQFRMDRDGCRTVYLYNKNGVDMLAREVTCSENYEAKIKYRISIPGRYYIMVEANRGSGYKVRYILLRK